MKRRPIAAIGIALASALAAGAASAAYEVVTVDPVTGTRVERVEYTVPVTRYETVVEERVVPRERIVVEADYVYRYPADEILLRPGYPDLSGYPDRISALNPQTGQLNDYGLFNRRGPNDFGR